MADEINPRHYKRNPSNIECIEVAQHFNFNRGNAIKYVWRAGMKDPDNEAQDLKKAKWYLEQEIARLESL